MSYSLTAITKNSTQQLEPGPSVPGQKVTLSKNMTNCTTKISITTQRFNSASKMAFSCVENSGIALEEGSMVQFVDNGTQVFQGFIFTAQRSLGGEVEYTAYDQTYYLKAKASYTFTNMTLEQIITQLATDFGLTIGTLEPTGYVFPCLIKDNTECLGMIYDALSTVIVQTGKIFVFYDDFGKLTLKEVKNMLVQQMLGNKSLVTDYAYKRDISSETYNRIKLVRPNKETGRGEVFMHDDTETQAKWGLLQYYDTVDENLNDAQIDELCQNYLAYYNRVVQSINISAMGVTGLRAGNIIPVRISQIATLSANRLLLAEKVTHNYEGANIHTMSIEVKNFEQLGGASWI